MDFNSARNARNRAASVAAGVETFPALVTDRAPIMPGSSPSRHDMNTFFLSAGRRFVQGRARRGATGEVTVVDLGCGSGIVAELLARAGVRGRYIGIDIARNRKWTDGTVRGNEGVAGEEGGELRKTLIVADIARFDASVLPEIDLLVSSTSLEHIEDDAGAIRTLEARLGVDGFQAHFVPGEEALELYGPHGWRQYSPLCLRRMFPRGTIYRYGGEAGNRVHRRVITERLAAGKKDGRVVHPRLYGLAAARAWERDALAGNVPATMYGVISE